MAYTPVPGSVVTVWEGGELALAVVAGEEKRRLRLIVENGREIRVQPSARFDRLEEVLVVLREEEDLATPESVQ